MKQHYSSSRRLLAGLFLVCAGAAGGVYADDAAFTSTEGIGPLNGQQIFERICAGCHMSAAEGAAGAGFYPKLAGDPKLVSWEYAALTLLNGRNGMPPFGLPAAQAQQTRSVQLSDAQIADVINYVRGHFGNKFKPDVTAKQVSALPHPTTVTGMPF
jgi:mono/diheme cytochrome c family protein